MTGSEGASPEARLSSLDWPELVGRLAALARSPLGQAACQALDDPRRLAATIDEARALALEVEEAANVLGRGIELPSLGFDDVRPFLDAAESAQILGPDELRPVALLCEITAEARRFFCAAPEDDAGGAAPENRRRPSTPELAAHATPLEPNRELARTIRETFDAAGEIRDEASPELARRRRERELISSRVRTDIERLMRDETHAPVMQDQFWTVRQDRYVLPLKASAKSMGLGIVHDSSRTGETVFVEPVAIVELNNRLKLADLEIQHEIRRILEALSRDVAEAAPALRANLEVLAELDVIAAKARLGVGYGGSPAALVDDTFVDLREARHPLLMLRAAQEHFRVVPNDIVLGGDAARVLIVSGPNAGGKTVMLKTIGLAALMVRAGMLLPAAPGSRIGFFHEVLPDIGDRQSVMGDLSTFSAHLANLAAILRAATGDAASASERRVLVLLDELMAGTNPEQGAALARATLETLAQLGDRALVVTTTHADALKALPESDPRFRNAGMEYDLAKLTPTFRVRTGTPGRSYAFDVAARMGMPASVLERAKELAGSTTAALEDVIATLEAREAALGEETARLAQARLEMEASTEDQRSARESLQRRERELAVHSRAAIEAAVREAREAIRAIVRQAQEAGSARAAEDARVALADTAEAVLRELPKPAPPVATPAATLKIGSRVRLSALGTEAVVAQLPDERGRLKVTMGKVTVGVHVSELSESALGKVAAPVVASPANRKDIRRANARAAALSGDAPPANPDDTLGWAVPSSSNTLDLRGQRADDVRDAVEAYLDRAALDDRSPVVILHGHGTGALKKIVREYLAASPYVKRWAPGGKGQGGDGVTIVEI
ncbi:MAG TPA: Smr/MutS family protein [Polyangia bacterium]